MVVKSTKGGSAGGKKVNSFSPKRIGIKKANSVIFGSVAGAAVVAAICIVVLNFLWDLRGFNNRANTARSDAVEILDSNVANLDGLERNFFALEQDEVDARVVLDSLPSKYDFPALATSIDKQVAEADLLLRNFAGNDESATATQKQVNPEPIEMPFVLVVEGEYKNIVKLLKNFEKTIRPMVVDSMDLTGTDSNLRAQLRMHTYYQPGVDITVETRTVQ